ncbi:MAG TPA: M23 family metallopeptidase [Longimicrobiales bacterium]
MPNLSKIASLAVIATFTIGAFAMGQPKPESPADAVSLGTLYAPPLETVQTHTIGSGETLNGVLAQAEISRQEMTDLLIGLREHMDPRRLSTGVEVTVRRWAESHDTRAVEVRLNRDTTVRLAKSDFGWDSDVVVTPTVVDTVVAAGSIAAGKTLYEALVFDEESPLRPADRMQLVYGLAEIFEYKLDFTREIQPGDTYRVAYVRDVRPDNSSRAMKILAAEIVNDNRTYDAVYFDNGKDIRGYYDTKGRALRAGFSRYPVPYPRITSRFAAKRYHPILGIYRAHLGNDLGARAGTQVRASANGVITFAGKSGGYGNMIEIRHANGYTTRYAHLRNFAPGIRRGVRVAQKDLIGYVGMTGLATAPHLHYELRHNGRPVDASKADLPDAEPLAKKQMAVFASIAENRVELLNRASTTVLAKQSRDEQRQRTGL